MYIRPRVGGQPLLVSLALALAVATAVPFAQDPQPQQPVFRTGVRVVRVDVTVTGRGGLPVDNLTAADFTLQEDGVPQKIDSAQFIRLDGQRAVGDEDALAIRSQDHAEAEAAREDVRLFAIFFDDYHVDKGPGVTIPMRAAIESFVRKLGPSDLVTLMDPLTPLSALRFTRDKQWLSEQVRKWEGRQGELFPVRSPIEASQYYSRNVRMVRAEVTLTALNALVARLGGLREGRKSIIFVSQGPPTFFGADGNIEDAMTDVLRNASRGNVAIHSLDPRGLGIDGRGGLRDTLLRLSYETGGRPIVNTNGLERGLEKVVDFASAYYLLGYTPTRESDDGKFHKIEVKVKRSGTDVLARRGYWAPSAEAVEAAAIEAARPETPGVAEALTPMSTSRSGRVADVWVGVRPLETGRPEVRVTWEPAPVLPDGVPGPQAMTVELLDRESGTPIGAPVELVSALGVVTEGALAAFGLPGTEASLRFTVLGPEQAVLDRWTQAVEVPGEAEGALPVSTLEFRRARSVVELRALRAAPQAAPSASRRFVRTDRVRVETAVAGTFDSVTATAELLNKAGERLTPLACEVMEGRVALELPLTSLVASTYLVRVRVGAGGRIAEQVAAFEVAR
jgi:VWFA-related protein